MRWQRLVLGAGPRHGLRLGWQLVRMWGQWLLLLRKVRMQRHGLLLLQLLLLRLLLLWLWQLLLLLEDHCAGGRRLTLQLLLQAMMRLLAGPELGRLQLLQVELLPLRDKLLALVLQALALPLHGGLQLLKVAQLDLQLLHLCLDEQRHQRLNLALLQSSQVLGFDCGGCQSGRRRRLHIVLAEGSLLGRSP